MLVEPVSTAYSLGEGTSCKFDAVFINFHKEQKIPGSMTTEHPSIEPKEILEEETVVQEPAKVILFNDEVHTFDEVIGQIIKATGCDEMKAETLTWEVHNTGRAMVYLGPITTCVQVSHVLEEIELITQIEV